MTVTHDYFTAILHYVSIINNCTWLYSYLMWLCRKKFRHALIVTVHHSHANALQCKNIFFKKQDTFDCILKNMIKSWSSANIQRTPEKCGRCFVFLRVKTGELASRKKKYKNITYVIKCIHKEQQDKWMNKSDSSFVFSKLKKVLQCCAMH